MAKENSDLMIPDERIINKIYLIRDQKVMLDRDLAELYGVETRVLKQQVKRNLYRFPEDFMFELTRDEFENWRSQFVTSNCVKKRLRYLLMNLGGLKSSKRKRSQLDIPNWNIKLNRNVKKD